MIVVIAPTIATASAVPSEVEASICEPIQSQASGTPTQRQRQPANISASSGIIAGAEP